MKLRFTLLYFAIFALSACKNDDDGQVRYDTIELEPYIEENYLTDAKQLYYHEIVKDAQHPNYDNVMLNDFEINNILKLIQAVYNLKTPERDTVFEKYDIHARYCYSFSAISMKVEPEAPEIQNLANNIFPTGKADLDRILKKYSIDSVKTRLGYPDFPLLSVHTDEEFNLIPIKKEFLELNSIIDVDSDGPCIGDGNTIEMERIDSFATLTFSVGEGDCPAGCIYRKYWEFRITNGKAFFVKAYKNR